DHPAAYVANSPIFYLDRVQTPLLIVHGSNDSNVAPFLADQVFVGLRRLGRTATYLKYAGETHGIEQYDDQIDCFTRIMEWFNRYLVPPKLADDGRLKGRNLQAAP